jgi:hypothetical protein
VGGCGRQGVKTEVLKFCICRVRNKCAHDRLNGNDTHDHGNILVRASSHNGIEYRDAPLQNFIIGIPVNHYAATQKVDDVARRHPNIILHRFLDVAQKRSTVLQPRHMMHMTILRSEARHSILQRDLLGLAV